MSYPGKGYANGQFLYWSVALGAYRWLPVTPPSTNQVLTWNGTEPVWANAGGFTPSGDLSASPVNQTVIRIQNRSVSSAAPSNGQVLTWVSGTSTWTPMTPSGGGNTFTVANNNIGYVGQEVVLRYDSTGSTLYAVSPTYHGVEDFWLSPTTPSLSVFEATPPVTTTAYPMDACTLEYREGRVSPAICVAYAYGNALRIKKCAVTNGLIYTPTMTWETAASVALSAAPSFVAITSVSAPTAGAHQRVVVAYVVSNVGYVVHADLSTNPPTVSTPVVFNDGSVVGGTITAVDIEAIMTSNYNTEFETVVMYSVTTDNFFYDRLYSRRCRWSGTTLQLGDWANLTEDGPTSQFGGSSIVTWAADGDFYKLSFTFGGYSGEWQAFSSYYNTFWPGNYYLSRQPITRIDGPVTGAGYLIDQAVSSRPHEGCFLDSTRYVSIIWGSRAGTETGTYVCVTDKAGTTVTPRAPKLISDTTGDLTHSSFPSLKFRSPTCRRITDKSFAFGAFQHFSDAPGYAIPFVGVGYVRDGGEIEVGYQWTQGYMYDPNKPGGSPYYSSTDDLQRVVPVRIRDNLFYAILLARTSFGGAPEWCMAGPFYISNLCQVVGQATTTSNPVTVQSYAGVLTGAAGTFDPGEPVYDYNGIPVAVTYRPGSRQRLGFALTSTSYVIVPNVKSG